MRARPKEPLADRCAFRIATVCTGRAEVRHHLKGRGNPELDMLTADICDACHRYVHAHPKESYERGWMLRRNGPMVCTIPAHAARPPHVHKPQEGDGE